MNKKQITTANVAVFRVLNSPVIEVIGTDLDSMQKVVGGYIEHVSLPNGLDLWTNEDGISLKLPLNRAVAAKDWSRPPVKGVEAVEGLDFMVALVPMKEVPPQLIKGGYHIVYGDFFISRSNKDGDIISITDEDKKLLGITS